MGLVSNRKDIYSESDLLQMVSRELRGTVPYSGESAHAQLMLKRGYAELVQPAADVATPVVIRADSV